MQPKTPAKSRKWLKILLGIVAFLIILFVGIYLFTTVATTAAAKVSDQFVADIQTNNPSAAYSLTAAAFQQATSQDQLNQLVSSVSPNLQGTAKITARKIQKTVGAKEEAVIVYSVTTNNGTKYIRVVLDKDSSWQVVNFRSSDTLLDTSSTN